MSLSAFASNVDKIINEFIRKIHAEYDIPIDELNEIVKEINRTEKSSETISVGCKAILKTGPRKDTECGAKISKNSSSGQYCSKHLKHDMLITPVSSAVNSPVNEDDAVFKKNSFGNLVYGRTKLVLKSVSEKIVIGKENDAGEIVDLDEEGIELCKKKKFKYIAEYSTTL